MTLRSPRERIILLCAYEICALGFAVPFYALQAQRDGSQAMAVIVAMMLAEMIWAMAHDWAFDWLDFRMTQRVASLRPKRWRIVHAISREGTTVVVTLPVLMLFGGHGFSMALWMDVQLTFLYIVYAFVFYKIFDRFRPVVPLVLRGRSPMQPPRILLEQERTAKA